MGRTTTIGYIVITSGWATVLGRDGVLWIPSEGKPATVFSTRASAQRAIKTTLQFAMDEDLGWQRDEYRITRLARRS